MIELTIFFECSFAIIKCVADTLALLMKKESAIARKNLSIKTIIKRTGIKKILNKKTSHLI